MKAKKPKKKIGFIIFVCFIAVAAVALYQLRPKRENYSEEIAKVQDIITYYSFSGNIASKDNQSVYSKSTLSIKKLHVKEGDAVKEGDLLFELDNSSIMTNLEQSAASVQIAEINYEKAQGVGKEQQMAQVSGALSSAELSFSNAALNLERKKELYNSGSISQIEHEQAQTSYDSALLSLESAQKNYALAEQAANQNIRTAKEQLNQARASYSLVERQLDDTKVYAEISGKVDEIYVEEDTSMGMNTKILDIINYDDLEVTIKVDEYDLKTVEIGKETKVFVNASNKEIIGTVSDISRQAVVVNGVSYFPTTLTLTKDPDLRVGMSVEVKILNQNEKDATTISMKALQFDNENKPFIYYRDMEGNVLSKYVQVGVNDGNIVQILDGVKAGETLLLPWKDMILRPGAGFRQMSQGAQE